MYPPKMLLNMLLASTLLTSIMTPVQAMRNGLPDESVKEPNGSKSSPPSILNTNNAHLTVLPQECTGRASSSSSYLQTQAPLLSQQPPLEENGAMEPEGEIISLVLTACGLKTEEEAQKIEEEEKAEKKFSQAEDTILFAGGRRSPQAAKNTRERKWGRFFISTQCSTSWGHI